MSPWINVICYVVIALLCAINWAAAYLDKLKLYYITKPLVLMAMMAYFALNDGFSSTRLVFFIALGLSLLGDVFLIPQRTRYFVAGMAAFALAHLAYMIGFSQWPVPLHTYFLAGFFLVLMVWLFHYYIENYCKESQLPRFQKRLFKVYGVLVAGMALVAWMSLARQGWQRLPAVMAGLGGSLFMISDLMIALDKLEKRIPRQRFWVISSYHIAQFLLISSVLKIK